MSNNTICASEILIGHGFHPDEAGIKKLYNGLVRVPNSGLDHDILSREEWELGERLVSGENLSLITPNPSGTRAQRIIASYSELVKRYDIAVHPHGLRMLGPEVAVYGATASPIVKGVASYLGYSQAIIRKQGIESIEPNTMAIEIGGASKDFSVPVMQEKLLSLAEGVSLTVKPIEEYIFVADISARTAKRFGLRTRYEPLEPLTPRDTNAISYILGREILDLCAYGWDGSLTDESLGVRGELISPRHRLPSDMPFYAML